ncbi:uncharacterized protein LOC130613685 [Hydractinia symbiolongicarpus]|uniref:uncharacterized protein LOC130613685 n=1 Tax=Hydractinia symbiolongicarpus TaxID=13093 RepID=UPI002549CC25|nr:uncharacterized protein LOC130613685 [Hydractinia symbiolongicarpus]
MFNQTSVFICLSLLSYLGLTNCSGILEIELVKYDGVTNFFSNGLVECREISRKCAYSFQICINKVNNPAKKQCIGTDKLRGISTTVVEFHHDVLNASASIRNPWSIPFQRVLDEFQMNFIIYNEGKFFDSLQGKFTTTYATRENTGIFIPHELKVKDAKWMNAGRKLMFQYRASCYGNYNLPDCLTPICIGRDDDFGHYTCSIHGNMTCLPGWKDITSNCTKSNVSSSISSAPITIRSIKTSVQSYKTSQLTSQSKVLETTSIQSETLTFNTKMSHHTLTPTYGNSAKTNVFETKTTFSSPLTSTRMSVSKKMTRSATLSWNRLHSRTPSSKVLTIQSTTVVRLVKTLTLSETPSTRCTATPATSPIKTKHMDTTHITSSSNVKRTSKYSKTVLYVTPSFRSSSVPSRDVMTSKTPFLNTASLQKDSRASQHVVTSASTKHEKFSLIKSKSKSRLVILTSSVYSTYIPPVVRQSHDIKINVNYVLLVLTIVAIMLVVLLAICLTCQRRQIRKRLKQHEAQIDELILRSWSLTNMRKERSSTDLSLDGKAQDIHDRNQEILDTPGGEFFGFVNQMFKRDTQSDLNVEKTQQASNDYGKRPSIGPSKSPSGVEKLQKQNKNKMKNKRTELPYNQAIIENAVASRDKPTTENSRRHEPTSVLPSPPPPPPPPPPVLPPLLSNNPKPNRLSTLPVKQPPLKSPFDSMLDEFRARSNSRKATTLNREHEKNEEIQLKERSVTLGREVPRNKLIDEIPREKHAQNRLSRGNGYIPGQKCSDKNIEEDEFLGFHNKLFVMQP